jgi:hypothetical protein
MEKDILKWFMKKITKRPKNKKEEQSQINAILFYLRTQNKNRNFEDDRGSDEDYFNELDNYGQSQ